MDNRNPRALDECDKITEDDLHCCSESARNTLLPLHLCPIPLWEETELLFDVRGMIWCRAYIWATFGSKSLHFVMLWKRTTGSLAIATIDHYVPKLGLKTSTIWVSWGSCHKNQIPTAYQTVIFSWVFFFHTGGSVVELLPLTEDLASHLPADANLHLTLPPAIPVENTAGKTPDQSRSISKQAPSFTK